MLNILINWQVSNISGIFIFLTCIDQKNIYKLYLKHKFLWDTVWVMSLKVSQSVLKVSLLIGPFNLQYLCNPFCYTEYCSYIGSTPSNLIWTWFRFWFKGQLCLLMFFIVVPEKNTGSSKTSQNHFLPHLFQFIIHSYLIMWYSIIPTAKNGLWNVQRASQILVFHCWIMIDSLESNSRIQQSSWRSHEYCCVFVSGLACRWHSSSSVPALWTVPATSIADICPSGEFTLSQNSVFIWVHQSKLLESEWKVIIKTLNCLSQGTEMKKISSS